MVRLHCPDAPPLLVRDWVQSAYARLTDYRPWSWTLRPGQLTWSDARTIAVTATIGSDEVTSAALFLPTDAGRQFRVGTYPIYTITVVNSTSSITLDQTFQGASDGAVSGQILDAYATMPADFGAFVTLTDPVNQRWVPWWMTEEELSLVDPTRVSAASTPRVLAAKSPSDYTGTLGQAQYEYWPIPEEEGSLSYYIRTRPTELVDSFVFKGVLAHRPDILQTGALAEAAKWPGTRDRPNPYFNLALARQLDQDFYALSTQLDLRDDDLNPQSLDKIPWQRINVWSWSFDTRLLQMTDATLGAYAGMGWYPDW